MSLAISENGNDKTGLLIMLDMDDDMGEYKDSVDLEAAVTMDDGSLPGFFFFANQPFRPSISSASTTSSDSNLTIRTRTLSESSQISQSVTMTTPQSITVTVLPASTNAGKETIRALLVSPPSGPLVRINALYRDPSKAPAEFLSHPNFSAQRGDVANLSTLDFSTSDVVFYIPPPTYDGTDTAEWAALSAGNVKGALEKASGSVKRLVLFSAIGAQHDHSIGILKLNHITDEILGDVLRDVVVIRPGYFMEGFKPWLEEADDTGVAHAWLTPLDYRAPVVSLRDISATVAREILKPFGHGGKSPRFIKIFGPRHYSSLDLQAAMSEALGGGKEIKLEAVLPDQLAGYFSQVVPPQYVQEFVDMTTAVLPGGIMVRAGDFGYEDEEGKNTTVVRGDVELVDGIRGLWEGMLAGKEEKGEVKETVA